MINPWFCYSLSFAVSILAYLLPWSALYPRLSASLFLFLISTVIVHFYFGYRSIKQDKISFKPIQSESVSSPVIITIFIYVLWSADFVYEGGIPLVKILLNQPYNYRLFGVPSLHVFTVTFASFYTIFLFHLFLSHKNKIILLLFIINLAASILIYSRAMFFFNLSSCFFLFLIAKGRTPRYVLLITPFALAVLMYFFGMLGTLRVSRESNSSYNSELFLNIGKSTQTFNDSFVPAEYFWTYIYVTSPLANLQHNIDTWADHKVSVERFSEMINNEVLMDFISKRINAFFGKTRVNENLIQGPFNVSTVYSRSYSYLGWWGLLIMATVVLVFPAIYMKILPSDSPFFLSGLAIMCTMFLFLAYDNTLRFTGLGFQLVYPLLLHYVSIGSLRFKGFFVNNKVTER